MILVVVAGCSTDSAPPSSSAPILSTTTQATATTSTTGATPSTTTEAATTTTLSLSDLTLTYNEVATGFDAPVLIVADPDGGQDLVVEQQGRIVRRDDGSVVLDIRDDVTYSGEQGLLGLAFHPHFATNRLAYVDYVGNGRRTVVEQFVVGDDGSFDRSSRRRIIEIPQPAANHNGGMIAFGPDGYLWIGMGDGGGSGDRYGQAQRADTLLGAMLRIAVGVEGVDTYAIPPDNPFADGVGGAPEVWAIGVRNPWRFAFDGTDLWIADVGQGDIEEIDLVSTQDPGLNFGWPIAEGSSCYRSSPCDTTSFVAPVVEYDHGQGCSVTGGVVYRGNAIPELAGQFFYSDYCAGFLRSHSASGGALDWTADVGAVPAPTGFGVGGDGELYVVSQGGSIFRLERSP